MKLSGEQKRFVTSIRKLFCSAEHGERLQGHALLKSLEDRSIAEVFVEGVSLDEEGEPVFTKSAIRRAHFKKKEFRNFNAFLALHAAGRLEHVTTLDLSRCPLTDLSLLCELTQLTRLSLQKCRSLNNLSGLEGLEDLTSLNLWGCSALSDLSPLEGLRKLTALDLTQLIFNVQHFDADMLLRLVLLVSSYGAYYLILINITVALFV